jgi:uncharacterized protein YjbI with pentapeptide repeats
LRLVRYLGCSPERKMPRRIGHHPPDSRGQGGSSFAELKKRRKWPGGNQGSTWGPGIIRLGRVEHLQWVPIPRVSTVPAEPNQRPWRRYLRFSVRGLIVVVLVVGGWLGWVVRDARIQRDAVAAIEGHCWVSYDLELNEKEPWAPRWIADRIGYDYFASVVEVTVFEFAPDADMEHIRRFNRLETLNLSGSGITEAGLAYLGELHDLRGLSLYNIKITEAGWKHLERLRGIERLDLSFTGTTDAGLAHAAGLSQLRELKLVETRITDRGSAHLKRLAQLRELDLSETETTGAGLADLDGLSNLSQLNLSSTQVTDAGLVHIKGLSNLEDLDLEWCEINGAGLAHLKGLSRLRKLHLSLHAITDSGMASIKGLTNLQELKLSGSRISDAAVAHLKGLSKLRALNLENVEVSRTAMANLTDALPNLEVDYGDLITSQRLFGVGQGEN